VSLELDKTAEAPEGEPRKIALAPGAQLGKYRLERVLGEGGMGVGGAVKVPDLRGRFALKGIRKAGGPVQFGQRLLREAVAMAKLKHPNVLTVYEAGTVADRDYIAMELVEGTSLDAWLEHRPPREEVWAAILAAGRGLAAAHEAGIVHRDFKPHNVLRSRDARILVTDFGLARAADDDESAPPTHDHANTVLDEKLTQTGALVGTPAYMAPEQYAGAAPDPRTDQFAFCVTAWQALTGDRPFKGQTLDEMKKAVGGGVAHLQAKLPSRIRAVLARGLDPDPVKRWPSLEALMSELERAERHPRKMRSIYLSLVALALGIGAAILVLRSGPARVANACDNPEAAFAAAWSPADRVALQRAAQNGPGFAQVAAAIDAFQERWVTSYQKACRARSARAFPARVRCLEGVRDQVNGVIVMLASAPPPVFEHLDTAGVLPQLAACERATPQAPPALPHDEPQRGQVLALFGRLMVLAGAPADQIATLGAALERDAAATGYKPASALVLVMTADAYLRREDYEHARAMYQRALPVAKAAGDNRLEARVHIGILEIAMHVLANPQAPVRMNLDDPRAQGVLHPELANAFSAARSAANDDAFLLGGIELMAAQAFLELAQWNRYRSAYVEALAHVAEARKQFQTLPDLRRDARASALEARIYLARGDERALDDAQFAARRAEDMLSAAGEQPLYDLLDIREKVAFARRDYNEVHRLADALADPWKPVAETVTGRVVPPRRARVVAWSGVLSGDPRRAYRSPEPFDFDAVESAEDGTFTVHARPGWAVIAESGDWRSLPIEIGTRPVTLTLAPTATRSVTVAGKNLMGVSALARYRVGDGSSWDLEVPVERDGTADLRGMPTGGAPYFGLRGKAGHATREVFVPRAEELAWPSGQALDVIVRGVAADVVNVNVSLDHQATASLRPVGASNTDAGREEYRPGDRHPVIPGNRTGKVQVCIHVRTCKLVDVKPTVEVDYPDGRYAAGVTPIVLGP